MAASPQCIVTLPAIYKTGHIPKVVPPYSIKGSI